MILRVLAIGGVVLGTVALLLAGQPGERAAGPPFKTDDYTLVWGKVKTTADVVLGDEKKSKYSIQLDGSMDAPTTSPDVVAVCRRFRIRTITDDKGQDMTPKAMANTGFIYAAYAAIHQGVGQVQVEQTYLPRDVTRIGTMILDTDVIVALRRDQAVLPAVVMEDYKDIGNGMSVRITSLQMSSARELMVVLGYKRPDALTTSPFIEKIYALDPDGKEIAGGRWTEGDPFGKTGTWTAKFPLPGAQRHQSFRLDIVTQSENRKLSFEVKGIFAR